MVLRPFSPLAPASQLRSAWDVIAATQQAALPAESWLIRQPDHAQLAGDLAAALAPQQFPFLSDDFVVAVGIHDDGWGEFDEIASAADTKRAHSFIRSQPEEFVHAWIGSVDAAEERSPLAGWLVSQHFCRLAKYRRENMQDTVADQERLNGFAADEELRRVRLMPLTGHEPLELETMTDVLQFCDLVSLYVCCGAREQVSLPSLNGAEVEIMPKSDQAIFAFNVPILKGPLELHVQAARGDDGTLHRETVQIRIE